MRKFLTTLKSNKYTGKKNDDDEEDDENEEDWKQSGIDEKDQHDFVCSIPT